MRSSIQKTTISKSSILKSSTPWEYKPYRQTCANQKKPLLYKTPAGVKLIFMFLFSAGVFISSAIFLPVAVLFLIVLSVNTGILPWRLLKGSAPLLVLCAGIFVLKTIEFSPLSINTGGLIEGSFFCLRMVISFAIGALLFATTTMTEIQKFLSFLEKVPGLQKFSINLLLPLMLGFIPRFFAIWEDTELAWISRGGKNSPVKYITLIPPVISALMEKAAETAEALESRGYNI